MAEPYSYQVTTHPLHQPKPPQFVIRIFYVTISNCKVGKSTPDHLTVNYLPPAVGSVNDKHTSFLRRDRVDRRTVEATFICTDPVTITSSDNFEIFNGGEMLIAGVMESGKRSGRWEMKCRSVASEAGEGILTASKRCLSHALVMEVLVAGCCKDWPVVMTQIVRLTMKEKKTVPEYEEVTDSQVDNEGEEDGPGVRGGRGRERSSREWFSDYRHHKVGKAEDIVRTRIYSPQKFRTWFNAGVGIGLGMCLSIGVALGTLIQTYNATTRISKCSLL